MDLGVVCRDRVGDGLHDHGLASLGRSHDEAALALANRCDEVDDPRREDARLGLEAQTVLRVERGQLAELHPLEGIVGAHAVDRVETRERRVLLTVVARADGLLLRLLTVTRCFGCADDSVTLAQVVALDHPERDVDVVVAREVARGPHERVVVEDVEDAGHRDEHVVLGDLRLVLVLGLATSRHAALVTVPVAVAVAATTATATTLVVIGVLVLTVVVLASLVLLALGVALVLVAVTWLSAAVVAAVADGVALLGGAVIAAVAIVVARLNGAVIATVALLGSALVATVTLLGGAVIATVTLLGGAVIATITLLGSAVTLCTVLSGLLRTLGALLASGALFAGCVGLGRRAGGLGLRGHLTRRGGATRAGPRRGSGRRLCGASRSSGGRLCGASRSSGFRVGLGVGRRDGSALAVLSRFDGGNEVALAHLGGAGDAHA